MILCCGAREPIASGQTISPFLSFCHFLVITGITYHATSYIVDNALIRCVVSLVVALTIFMFDRALYQSDWFIQAEASRFGHPRRWLRIALRLSVSICLAYVLSLFLELALFSDLITEKLQKDFKESNASLFQRGVEFERELDAQIAERAAALNDLETRRSEALDVSAESASSRQRRDLQRQLDEVSRTIARFQEDKNAELYGQRTRPSQTGQAGRGSAYHFADVQVQTLREQRQQIEAQLGAFQAADRERIQRLEEHIDVLRQEVASRIAPALVSSPHSGRIRLGEHPSFKSRRTIRSRAWPHMPSSKPTASKEIA